MIRKLPPLSLFQSLERRVLITPTQIDLSFGSGGYVYTHNTDTIYDMAVQSDGKLLAAGCVFKHDALGDFGVIRYNPDGSIDTTFGSNGTAWADFYGYFDRPYSIALLANGKILVAGEADT